MTDELEERLARVFNDRAGSITTVPTYSTVSAAEPSATTARRMSRPSRTRTTWYLSAAAVAAVMTVLASVLAFGIGHNPSPSTDHRSSCLLARSPAFLSARHAGTLPAGSVVLAGASSGELLVAREQSGATTALDLINRAGGVTRVWTAHAGERVQAFANPSGAIDRDGIVFALRSLASHTTTIMVTTFDGVLTRLSTGDPGYQLSTDPDTAPVYSAGQISILETSTARPSEQKLFGFVSEAGGWVPGPLGVFSGVMQLLPVGGNLLLTRQRASGSVELAFDPQYRPIDLLPAASAGYAFSTDRTTLSWLTGDRGNGFLWQWRPGQPAPSRRPLPGGLTASSTSGGYVAARPPGGDANRVLVNAATGAVAELPAGTDLVQVYGPYAVLSYPSSDGLVYSRVPLAAITSACR